MQAMGTPTAVVKGRRAKVDGNGVGRRVRPPISLTGVLGWDRKFVPNRDDSFEADLGILSPDPKRRPWEIRVNVPLVSCP